MFFPTLHQQRKQTNGKFPILLPAEWQRIITDPQTKKAWVFGERGIRHATVYNNKTQQNTGKKCSASLFGKLVETACALVREGRAHPCGRWEGGVLQM